MQRRNFVRNILLGMAAYVIPKVLMPILSDIQEEMVEVNVRFVVFRFEDHAKQIVFDEPKTINHTFVF